MSYDEGSFEHDLDRALDEVKQMLMAKNRAYGDSALRGSSIASASLTIKIRMLDKMRRIESGQPDETEDVWTDLLGYGVLLMIAQRRELEGDDGALERIDRAYARVRALDEAETEAHKRGVPFTLEDRQRVIDELQATREMPTVGDNGRI